MSRFVFALIVLALVSASAAQDAAVDPGALENRIWELRLQARYGEAADAAGQLLEFTRSGGDARPFEIADAERVVESLRQMAGLPEGARRELALADSLAEVDEACWDECRYSDGEAAVRQQLEIRRRLLGSVHLEVAASLNELAYYVYERGDYASWESLEGELLVMRRKLLGDEHPDIASSLNGLAECLASRRDYAEAELLHREALAMRRKLFGEEHPDVAISLHNLASLLEDQGVLADAESLYLEALAINRRTLGDHHHVAGSLNNLAMMYHARADYARAESLQREALAMFRRVLGNEHPDVARGMNNLAMIFQVQGDSASAEPLYREALTMWRRLLGTRHPDVARCMSNLATLLDGRGEFAEAGPLFLEALQIQREFHGGENPYVAEALNNLAMHLLIQGDYAGAEELYRESLAMHRNLYGEENPRVAVSLCNLGSVLEDRGDSDGAEQLYRESLAMRRKLLGDENAAVALTLQHIAALLHSQGDFAAAEPLLAEAAHIYDTARLSAGAGLKRVTFQGSPYPRLVAVRLASGRVDEAWPAAERALARSLADLLMVTEARDLSQVESAREDSLKRILGKLERELAVYRESATNDTTGEVAGRVEQIRNTLLDAESDWSAFQQEMTAKHPVTEGETFPLDRVQLALSEESAIIGWLDVSVNHGDSGTSGYDSWCYAVRSTGPVVWARAGAPRGDNGSTSPVERAQSFRDHLANPATADTALTRESHQLWAERVEPLLEAFQGVNALIVVPSGAMLGVPVEVLLDNEGSVIGDAYAVSYAPSATIHTWLAERPDRGVGSGMLLVGDPPYSAAHLAAMRSEDEILLASTEPPAGTETLRNALAGNAEALRALPRLRGTRAEVEGVGAMSGLSSILLGPEATEQEIVRLAGSGELKAFRAIHIATHALVDDERPERSALVLSQVDLPDALEAAVTGTRIYDGLVTVGELLQEWDLNADLVTLSACETGLGRSVVGEGYIGFAHAFLQAGARSLLVSLWVVDDTATSLLMRRFYENWLGEYEHERNGWLGEPMPKTEALREAKSWLRDYADERGEHPYRHPYFWSAFILLGDPS